MSTSAADADFSLAETLVKLDFLRLYEIIERFGEFTVMKLIDLTP